jgi:hypothetical protein
MATITETFPCIGCDETDFHLASTTWASNFTSNSSKYDNLKTEASSTTSARINVDKTVSANSYFYLLFDFSNIPNNATITNTVAKVRLYSTGNQAASRQIRWCVGDINSPLRTSQNYSTQSNPTAISLEPLQSGISVSDLKNVKCHVHYTRTNRTDNTQRYIYVYGADVTVTYEVPDSGGLYYKANGDWEQLNKVYKKENGSWVEQTDLTNVFESDKIYVRN